MNLHEFTVYLEIFRVRRRYEEGHKKAIRRPIGNYYGIIVNYWDLLGFYWGPSLFSEANLLLLSGRVSP